MTIYNKFREIDVKNYIYYYFDDINDLDSKKIKVNKKACKDNLTYYIGYVASNDVKHLYIFLNKINGYIKDNERSKHLILIPIDENKKVYYKKYK